MIVEIEINDNQYIDLDVREMIEGQDHVCFADNEVGALIRNNCWLRKDKIIKIVDKSTDPYADIFEEHLADELAKVFGKKYHRRKIVKLDIEPF